MPRTAQQALTDTRLLLAQITGLDLRANDARVLRGILDDVFPPAPVAALPVAPEPAFPPLPPEASLETVFAGLEFVAAARAHGGLAGYLRGLAKLGRDAWARQIVPSNAPCSHEDYERLVRYARAYAGLLDVTYTGSERNSIEAERQELLCFLDRIAPQPPTVDELAAAVRALFDASPVPSKQGMLPQYNQVQAMLARVPK